jgi:hypothetical protein
MPINTQSFGNTQAHSEMDQRDDGSVTHRHSDSVNMQEVRKCLEGMRFPASKNDIVEHATERQASSRILNLLQQLQTPEFGSPNAQKSTIYDSFEDLEREIQKIG